jgi:hypothetical protein
MPIYTTWSDCQRTLYFKIAEPLEDIFFMERVEGFAEPVKKFSYSLDNCSWTEWSNSLSGFCQEVQAIEFSNVNIYIRVNIELLSIAEQTQFKIYELLDVKINHVTFPVEYMEFSNNSSILNTNSDKNLFNPYRNFDPQKKLYDKLSKSISDIFGFEAIWFRTSPQQCKESIVWRTYEFSNVIEYKSLKIVINENSIPDNRHAFSEFDIDFQDEMECHIVKEVFAKTFGDVEPNANDYLYLPLTDRMYQVNTIYEAKEFANHATYWRAMLIKYEERASVRASIESDLEVDSLIDFETEYNPDKFDAEKSDAVNQYMDAAKTAKQIKNISKESVKLENSPVFKWAYNYNGISNSEPCLVYNFSSIESYSIIFWTKFTKQKVNIFKIKNVLNQVIMTLKYDMTSLQMITNCQDFKLNTSTVNEKPITIDKFFGIVVNIGFGISPAISCSVIDKDFKPFGECSERLTHNLSNASSIEFYGGNHYANIRIAKNIIPKPKIPAALSKQLPKPSNYYIIDNAVPQFNKTINEKQCT